MKWSYLQLSFQYSLCDLKVKGNENENVLTSGCVICALWTISNHSSLFLFHFKPKPIVKNDYFHYGTHMEENFLPAS